MMLRPQLASLTFAVALTIAGCGEIGLSTDGGGGDGAAGSATGSAGTNGSAGTGSTGAAGTTTGAAGTGTTMGTAGTTGTAGTGMTTGTAGTTGSGGAGGRGGTTGSAGMTGSAGTTGTAGTTGSGGAGGRAGTSGSAGTMGSAGTTGMAGTTGTAGTSGSAGTGGAGTGGMCGPVCTIFCQYGNVLDANGCPTCMCKPAPGTCTAQECGTMPAYKAIICQSGQVNPAACTRGTDGVCAWHGPTCKPCPALNCANVICPAAAPIDLQPDIAIIPPPNGCPTCCGPPIATTQ